MLSFVIIIIGFVWLVWGADHFVSGASSLAKKMGIPTLIIGLTVVAFGTSAPELAVSVTAALNNANEIAVGNILGSNIFNLLVVAGISAIICPLALDKMLLQRDWPISYIAAMLLGLLIFFDGELSKIDGIILLTAFAIVLIMQFKSAFKEKAVMSKSSKSEPQNSPVGIAFDIILGFIAIVLGGKFAVDGAVSIAQMLGISETIIGLTVVAIGTSLPELVTSIAASRKGENDIAMGNVIGSNIFNILLILGVSSFLTPIATQPTAIMDIAVLLIISVLLLILAKLGKFNRLVGCVMVLTYIFYTGWIMIR